jgi:hypothetical protein
LVKAPAKEQLKTVEVAAAEVLLYATTMTRHRLKIFSTIVVLISAFLSSSARAQTTVTTDLEVPAQNSLDWLTLTTPVLGGLGAFHFTFGPTPNPGDPNRPDQAFTIGWNSTHNGAAAIAGEPALMWRFEDYYNPFGTRTYMESHLQYVSASGTVVRPYALQIDRGSDFTTVVESADAWNYMDRSAQTQYLKAQPGVFMLLNSMRIISYTNNQSTAFQMLNAAGTGTIRLPYANNQDQTVVDVDAKGTVFGANVEAPSFSSGGKPGVTVSGTNCVITQITNGLITGATCSS